MEENAINIDELRAKMKSLSEEKTKIKNRNTKLSSEISSVESNLVSLGRPVSEEQIEVYDNKRKIVIENNRQLKNNIGRIEEISTEMLEIDNKLRDSELSEVNSYVVAYCKVVESHNKKIYNLINYINQFKEETTELLKDEVRLRGELTDSMKKNGFNDFSALINAHNEELDYNLPSRGKCRELMNSVMNVAKICERGI